MKDQPPTYRKLESGLISAAIAALGLRINERFPDASLKRVASELHTISTEHQRRIRRIGRPNLLLRAAVFLLMLLAALLMTYVISLIDFSKTNADSVYSVLQGIEASVNIVVLMTGSLIFLFTVEQRVARRRALNALAELRSIVHVIDMHQLTKDPASVLKGGAPTAHSPPRTMSPFELGRYLDYCAELLALTGKVAALYAQSLPDTAVVEAVSDLERTTTALAQKVWQKIAILNTDRVAAP
jgi:hypothetical protein